MGDAKSIAHTKWNCKYHIFFAPKYRRQVFYGEKKSAIIEVKHASARTEFAFLVGVELQQIDEKEYDAPLRDNYETVIHWGIAFFEKRCIAKFKAAISR